MDMQPQELTAIRRVEAELVDDDAQFFAPVASDLLDTLLGQYQSMRRRIDAVAAMVTGETAGAIRYFMDGNKDSFSRYAPPVEQVFKAEGAVAALNAAYWSKTMNLTDVYDAMPQARRDEWNKQITEMTAPDFEEDTVRATISGLLAMRSQFLAERVDGIFRGLSGEHVTNCPEAFGKRMIIAYVLSEYSTVGHQRAGLINDLRAVIAKFMGRDEPKHFASSRLIETLRGRWGEWFSLDGGALRIRLYKKGTAHLEVHPDMAWRLNQILAHLHPLAIPSQFSQRPVKRVKDFDLIARPLPFAVLEILAEARPRRNEKTMSIPARFFQSGRAATDAAAQILESIGGAEVRTGSFEFDYSPGDVIDLIVASGCVPDEKSHQFYPTPKALAERLVQMADIGPDHKVLEPSAGQGGIAGLLPKGRTLCIEVAPLNVQVLQAKGHAVRLHDFLALDATSMRVDRVVMNPPFNEGRAAAHVLHAASMVNPGGRLVAILPSGQRTRLELPGFSTQWTQPIDGAFPGVSVSVVILTADREPV